MKRIAFYIFGFIFLAGCQGIERTKEPNDLIPEDKMVDVLTEVALLNSARNYNKRLFEGTGIEPESYIYKKYDIDSLQLERSNTYYSENYTQYEEIYSRVKERLENLKTELDSIREEEIRIEDSISKEKMRIEDSIADSIKEANPELDSLSIDSLVRKESILRDDFQVQEDSIREDNGKADSLIQFQEINQFQEAEIEE